MNSALPLSPELRRRFAALIRAASVPLSPIPAELPRAFNALAKAEFQAQGTKAVLFDLYGTLFISAAGEIAADPSILKTGSGTAQAGKTRTAQDMEALTRMGRFFRASVLERHETAKRAGTPWPEVRVEEIWASYDGPVLSGWPEWNAGGKLRDEKILELALRYELEVNAVYPMPGAFDTIKTLAERGVVLGIISNAQFFSPLLFDAFAEKTSSPADLGFTEELCFYSCDALAAKPSPALFTAARNVLVERNIGPGETLYIGNDMRSDILPARTAGFMTALFAGDRRSLRLRDEAPGLPDMVIRDLCTLLRLPIIK